MIDFAPFEQAWAKRHEPVPVGAVAVLTHNVPLELIVAAGLQARRVFPQTTVDTPLADAVMEPIFDGAVRSLFDQFLAGHVGRASLAVVPRSSEGYLQLYYFLQEMQRLKPELALPDLHLFDLLKTPNWLTRRYVRDQLIAMAAALKKAGGHAADDAALARAIKLCNHQRKLMADVNALRLAATPRVAGSRMFQITAAAGVMPIAQHIAALQAVLDAALALPPIKGLRLMVKGSAPDDLSLHSLLESIGAVVVADDHANGDGCFVGQVSESGEPLDALAQYYHQVSASPRSLPQTLQDQRFMARAHAAQVQGVVFVVEAHDDTVGWDIPAQKRMLDVAGIPSLCLLHQPYRRNTSSSASSENARRTALQDWLASLGTR